AFFATALGHVHHASTGLRLADRDVAGVRNFFRHALVGRAGNFASLLRRNPHATAASSAATAAVSTSAAAAIAATTATIATATRIHNLGFPVTATDGYGLHGRDGNAFGHLAGTFAGFGVRNHYG